MRMRKRSLLELNTVYITKVSFVDNVIQKIFQILSEDSAHNIRSVCSLLSRIQLFNDIWPRGAKPDRIIRIRVTGSGPGRIPDRKRSKKSGFRISGFKKKL